MSVHFSYSPEAKGQSMRSGLLIGLAFLWLSMQAHATEPVKDPRLFSLRINNDKFDMTYQETLRGENYSVAMVKFAKGGNSPLGSGMCIFKGATDVAKMRGFDYFFKAKEWKERGDYYVFKFYYLNDKSTDLKSLLGDDYSREAQDLYDTSGYLSVDEYSKVIKQTLGKD